jgi:eukaryotic-like serine/threonine-protein kinase
MNELDLFAAAIAIADPSERALLLERECAGRPELRLRLDHLLDAHFGSSSLLDQPDVDQTQGRDQTQDSFGPENTNPGNPGQDEQAGVVIAGKYTLVEGIGKGGMGSVWRARQTAPVKRFVAVKLIKPGMDSKQVLARFDAERQALALMDHPNIAKVLDGGLHEHRPYFVMELVKGVPITEYCDRHRLTPKARLELFVPVCQAIQHAHQKGIIHRDIKPSNVLIALYDDKPVVKVIDFGVAKATGGTLTEHTIDTGFGGVVGTPQYMSPEQATFNNLDVDTRSDVYALGVLLYELLTGSPPFSNQDLEKRGLLEMLRVVREEEPPRPSTKLSTADALPTLSANRGTEPTKLAGLLRNELDWVVMKALEKDRSRRYETANAFAADVQRYLSGEAVQAHPPSASYRLRKFVRRNRPQVIAAALVLAALLAGVVGTSVGLERANRAAEQERQAKVREAERAAGERQAKVEADAKRQEAERNLAFAKKGNEILGSVFAALDPKADYATVAALRTALRDNLAKAVGELDGSAIGDPLEVAAMQDTLGLSLLGLGEANLAIDVLGKSLATNKERLGADHPDTLASTNNLALGYQAIGKMDRALPLLEELLRLRTAKLGADHPDTLTSMNNLASGYQVVGKMDRALPLFEETLKLTTAKLGADHHDTLIAMGNLARGYYAVGKKDRALPLLEETLRLSIAKFGTDHPDTLVSMNNLAAGYKAVGKMDRALPLLEETLRLMTVKMGADHPDTFTSMSNLAQGYQAVGKMDRALPLFEETLRLRTAKSGADHPDALVSMGALASGYEAVGKMDRALPLFEQAATGFETRRFQHAYAKAVISRTIAAYETAQQFDKAESWRRKWLAVVKAEAGVASPAYAGELAALGSLLLKQQKWADAEPILRESLAIREKTQPDLWTTFNTQSMLGGALLGQKKYASAEPLLQKGYDGMQTREKTIPPQGAIRIPESLDRLIELYTATNKPDDVKKWQADRAKYPQAKPEGKK